MRSAGAFRKATRRWLDDSIHAARHLAQAHPGALPAYDRLLRQVQRHTRWLRPAGRPGDSRNPLNTAVLALALHHADWLRPPEAWKPGGPSPWPQAASLAHHLLARYPVPACLTSVWFDPPPGQPLPQHGWFKHLGRGGSLRTAGLPLRLTRAMAHRLGQAPHHYRVFAALRWAQVVGMGGGEALARAVAATPLGRGPGDEPFWEEVLRFLVRHPTFPLDQVGPLVDCLRHQRGEASEGVSPAGVFGPLPPPRPDFSLQGRTVASVLRLIEDWHRDLGLEAAVPLGRTWRPSPLRGFRLVEVSAALGTQRVWEVTELLAGRDLVLEGRALRHCVATYAGRCPRGQASIWSLRLATGQGRFRVLTVEVDVPNRTVGQARGWRNRYPTAQEWEILRLWAAQEGLTMAKAACGAGR
jgi:hypothetical protein